MKFCIVVYAAPYSSEAASTAFRFTKSLLENGHEVTRVFFFSDGVHNASKFAVTPQDEINLQSRWDKLIRQHSLDVVACVSSAIKRGILNKQEAKRYELDGTSLMDSAEIAGLGQLIDASLQADRVVNFG